ncbi:MAG: mandelate racemase/muconate lactonizing enzyme family protein [Pseudomonadota bacterium]
MLRISSIEISHHRLVLDPPFKASWDGRPRREFDASIVRITDDEGRVGVGSGDLMLGFEGHEDLFVGEDPRNIDRHYKVLSHIQFHYGRCWPVDLALWDLIGKVTNSPVWKLIGGKTDRLRLYASTGVLRDPDAMAEGAVRLAEAGFAGLKMRFTSSAGGRKGWRHDVKAAERIRAAVPEPFAIMVDCNQGWRMPWDTSDPWVLEEALEVAKALEPLSITWMEEPLHRADRKGMAALRQSTSVPVAGGEMTRELYEFRDLINDGCLDVVQPDVALVGGISGLREVVDHALRAGITFTPHSWTNGIGVLANAHLAAGAAGSPWFEWPYDPPEWSLDRRDYPMTGMPQASGGWLQLSDKPGLGFELDDDLLDKTRVR